MILVKGKKEVEERIESLASELLEKVKSEKSVAIIGIHTRGIPLASRIIEYIKPYIAVEKGQLDITFYRDDLSKIAPNPVVKATKLPPIDDKVVVLIDDVLYTGRTVRAALDELIDFGRPKKVYLVVLVDREERELPICADFIGFKIKVKKGEKIDVKFPETDGSETSIYIRR